MVNSSQVADTELRLPTTDHRIESGDMRTQNRTLNPKICATSASRTAGARPTLLLLLLILGGISSPPGQAAAPPVAAATTPPAILIAMEGRVEYMRASVKQWAVANAGLKLFPGDRLRTGARSRATVQLANRMRQRLISSSTLFIEKPKAAGQRATPTLQKGSMYFHSRQRPRDQRFRTPLVSGAIRGTEFYLTVADNGETKLTLLDGEVDLENEKGKITLAAGEQGSVSPNEGPKKTAVLDADAVVQWALYYPAVVDVTEIGLDTSTRNALQASIDAYQAGDLLAALAAWPQGRQPISDAEKVFRAALLLSVGKVDETEAQIANLKVAGAGKALRSLIATVRGDTEANPAATIANQDETAQAAPQAARPDSSASASASLAESYFEQRFGSLENALTHAETAAQLAPEFGFAWARIAELEFSFGRTGKALTALEKALSFSPRNAQAHALRGYLLSSNGEYIQAGEAFQHAIDIDSALPTAWLGLGLSKIARGQRETGREDLQTAALLDPRRAIVRSYLGKAFSHEGNQEMALKELSLSRRLDPNDPTAPLYSALIHQQQNRVNRAVRDLEESLALNENRGLYRSGLLLDKDRAVRGANLALIYRDAGMKDVSAIEAYKAIQNDPANYAAHLFLANSLNEKRDIRGLDQRFETPAVGEFLAAALLAPEGGGTLAQSITSQEYSRFFEGRSHGFLSSTDYSSEGQWLNANAVYGEAPSISYSVGSYYQNEAGTRINNDIEILSLNAQVKFHLTPKDSVYLQAIYTDAEGGDRAQRYDPTTGLATFRFDEVQGPIVLAGFHHEWTPGSRTLFLAGWLDDTLNNGDPALPILVTPGGFLPSDFRYTSKIQAQTAELQQIWQDDKRSFVVGLRGQLGDFDTAVTQSGLVGLPMPPFPAGVFNSQAINTDFHRFNTYAYHTWRIIEPLTLSAGVSYDHIHFPQNFRNPPISAAEESRSQVSPKAGLLWTPRPGTAVRFAYTRSLGGVGIDQSFRLEPTQVAGINQAYRSLIPESLAGGLTAPAFETWGAAIDQKFKTGTYVGVLGEILKSDASNTVGSYVAGFAGGTLTPVSLSQKLDFTEHALTFYANQLLAEEWSLGARYRLSFDDLHRFTRQTGINENFEATLQELDFFVLYNHSCGFFARAESLWRQQSNVGFAPAQPGDDVWQHNLIAGYRFSKRRAEIQIGVLNLADADYQLNPLSSYRELPHERVFAGRLRLSF